MIEMPTLRSDGTHIIPIWKVTCAGCQPDSETRGLISWHPERGVTFSIGFPKRSAQTLSRYYSSPSVSVGAGSFVEDSSAPRWVGETADGFEVRLFGLDETLWTHTSHLASSSEVTGNARFVAVGMSRNCALAFYDQTPPKTRTFFLGFKSFYWPKIEEIAFPYREGRMETSRRSVCLDSERDIGIFEASNLVNLLDGAWLTNVQNQSDRWAPEYRFLSFLTGRRANVFWQDVFVEQAGLQRIYYGSERIKLQSIRDAESPFPLMYASAPRLAREVISELPALFGRFLQLSGDVDVSFILAPLWSAYEAFFTDRIALASVSLERLAAQWNGCSRGETTRKKASFLTDAQRARILSLFNATLDSIPPEVQLTPVQVQVIRSRLMQLGQPTNSENLLSIFSDLGLILTDDERDAVKSRNLALHGRTKLKDSHSISEVEAEAASFDTIRMLITKAMLQILEYRGPYVNYAGRLHQQDFPVEWLPPKCRQ